MKKIFTILITLLFLFMALENVEAKTLGDLKKELESYKKELETSKQKQNLTKDQMNNVNNKITKINEKINNHQQTITNLTNEITELEQKADDKEEEIKDVMLFVQVADSENAYLEYIFGSKTIEDLILRSAISKQLIDYNDELIDEYNETVIECKDKQDQLKKEIVQLNSEQNNLKAELVTLGDQLNEAMDVSMNAEKQIKAQQEKIDHYEKLGCKDDDDIYSCEKVPYTSKMLRQLASGYVSSEYGMRYHPVSGVYKLHSGIDVTGSTNVYPVADGVVAGISWYNSCGGTMIFVQHNIGGVYYTTGYYHVYKVLVSVGQQVKQDQVIAITGGTPSLTPWDTCTTGRHNHLTVATGLYLTDYTSWSTYTSHLINPRTVVNFPAKGVWFSNRTKIY